MKKQQLISTIISKESRCAVLEENGKVLNYSKKGGINAGKDLYDNYKNELKNSFVGINLLSRATAALLIKSGVVHIYAYKLSKHAISLLEQYNIEYSYGELLDFISSGDKSTICPFEKMSIGINNVDEIVGILENSLNK